MLFLGKKMVLNEDRPVGLPRTPSFSDLLGEGEYGRVVRGPGLTCAKIFHSDNFPSFIRESYYMSKMRGISGVVGLIGVKKSDDLQTFSIVLPEYSVNLQEWLQESVDLEIRIYVAKRLIRVFDKIHSEAGIIHGDIKLSNVMLDLNSRVRVIDFGLSGYPGISLSHNCSELYKSTVIRNNYCDDVYSLGVLLYELITGELLDGKILASVARDKIVAIDFSENQLWSEIIFSMVSESPSFRPSLSSISSLLGEKTTAKRFNPVKVADIGNTITLTRKEITEDSDIVGEILTVCTSTDMMLSKNAIKRFNFDRFEALVSIV